MATITGTNGADTLFGTINDDTILAKRGGDTVFGNEGNDTIFGAQGGDFLFGGIGNDRIFGGLGNDQIYGDEGNDFLHGNRGNDTIFGGSGDDVLTGGLGNDRLFGDESLKNFNVTVAADLWDSVALPSPGGAAKFRVFVDGVQIGPDLLATANARKKESQVFAFDPNLITAASTVTVEYLNDTAGVFPGDTPPAKLKEADRNLHVIKLNINGTEYAPTSAFYDIAQNINDLGAPDRVGQQNLYWNGKLIFNVAAGDFFSAGNDRLQGGAGDDFLSGGRDTGSVTLKSVGMSGKKKIVVTGGDHLTGGAGKDTFSYAINDGVDIINDFDKGADKLNLVGIAMGAYSLIDAVNGTLVDLGGGKGIYVKDVTAADLAADIVLV
jgi:Ca2+-binding RTX toxin-like protein